MLDLLWYVHLLNFIPKALHPCVDVIYCPWLCLVYISTFLTFPLKIVDVIQQSCQFRIRLSSLSEKTKFTLRPVSINGSGVPYRLNFCFWHENLPEVPRGNRRDRISIWWLKPTPSNLNVVFIKIIQSFTGFNATCLISLATQAMLKQELILTSQVSVSNHLWWLEGFLNLSPPRISLQFRNRWCTRISQKRKKWNPMK